MVVSTLIGELLNNVTFLLMLTMFYNYLVPYLKHFSPIQKRWIQGVLFGFMAVLSTLTSDVVVPGHLLDGRNIIIAISGVFGGPASAFITTIMSIVCRFLIGGEGVIGAVAAAVIAAIMGTVFRYRYRPAAFVSLRLMLLGFFVAVQRLFWTYVFGGTQADVVVAEIMLPILLVYPLGTLLIASLIRWKENNVEMRQRLEESEAYFREMSEASFEGIAITEYGTMIEVNSNFAAMAGYSASELIGMRVEDMVPAYLLPDIRTKIQEGFDKPYDSMLLRKDGTMLPVEVQSKSITYKGRLCRVNAMRDLSERIEVQKTLAQERDMLRTLIDQLPDYIFVKDELGRFVVSNQAHTTATQKTSIIGKTACEVFPPELAAQYHADDLAVMESGQAIFNAERSTLGSDGSTLTVLTTKVPLYDFSGRCTGLVGISRDITERKAMDEEKLRYTIERERIGALHRFMRDISHDLRTPLAVIGTSMYMLGRFIPEEQKHRINIVNEQLQHLTKLLDKMSDTLTLETQSEGFTFKPLQLTRLLERLHSELQPIAATKQQVFRLEVAEPLPPLRVDEASLKVGIESVIKNAMRYTPQGGEIVIAAGLEAEQVVISVRDNGIGISKKDLDHIFEHFYRVDQARGMNTGSAGLGLSIAKRIIEQHGGKISVESTPGEGSTFKIVLPLSIAEAKTTS